MKINLTGKTRLERQNFQNLIQTSIRSTHREVKSSFAGTLACPNQLSIIGSGPEGSVLDPLDCRTELKRMSLMTYAENLVEKKTMKSYKQFNKDYYIKNKYPSFFVIDKPVTLNHGPALQ